MTLFTLNWFGMGVHDVLAASDFYGGKLGFAFEEGEENGHPWRYFETRGMTFELFQANPERPDVNAWGDGQAFRPVLRVSDLAATSALLRDKGISYSENTSEYGAPIEIIGPEGIRWGIMESSGIEMDWARPFIAGVELRVADLDAQKEFYTEVLGMTIGRESNEEILLNQKGGEAWLRMEAGGTSAPRQFGEEKPAFFHPTWISFETEDVRQANLWLQSQNVTILHPLTYHEHWQGTDIIIADADDNAVQIVQYGRAKV
jgi:catechol 2,3-dioxygenase-like lactoylglutathione lyase family enzyme